MITFSFKREKKKKEEKYSYPMLTQHPYERGNNNVAKFSLNLAALTCLGYPVTKSGLKNCKISVGRNEFNGLILANTTDIDTDHQYNVTQERTFNSKFLMDKLRKAFPIDEKKENEFELSPLEAPDGTLYVELSLFTEGVDVDTTDDDNTDVPKNNSWDKMLSGVLSS